VLPSTNPVTRTLNCSCTTGTDTTWYNSNYSGQCSSIPATPTGLSVTPSSCGNNWLNISWNSSSGATSYQVYRDGSGTPIYNSSGTAFSDTGLALGSTHSYTVRATNSSGSSGLSGSVSGTVASSCPVGPIDDASCGSVSTSPSTIYPGNTINVTRTMNNTGNTTWDTTTGGSGGYKLGNSVMRATLSSNVSPGSSRSFSYTETAQAAAGSQTLNSVQMVIEGVKWFGSICAGPTITVSSVSTYSCNRCSNLYKNQRVAFQSEDSTCAQVLPSTNPVTRSLDCSCTTGSDTSWYDSNYPGQCASIPPTPTGLSVNPSSCGNNWLNLSWNAVSGATAYKVYRDGATTPVQYGSTTYFSDTGLVLNSTHYYTVQALNSAGASAKSAAVYATVAPPCSQVAPSSVNFLINGSSSSFTSILGDPWTLSITSNLPNKPVSVCTKSPAVWCGTAANLGYAANTDSSGAWSATGNFGATGNYIEYIKVDTTSSNDISFTVNAPATSGLPYPTGLTVNPSACGNNWLNLSWNAVSGATGYKVYRDGGATPVQYGTSLVYTDRNLVLGRTYSYTVQAVDSTRSSSLSPSVSATVASACSTGTAPAAPTNFTAAASSCGTGKINLSWNNSSGATSYTLIRGGGGTSNLPPFNSEYFAAPTGTGTTCSSGSPCLLSTALGKANAGDRVTLKDGVYNEALILKKSGTAGSYITIRAEHDNQAVIRIPNNKIIARIWANYLIIHGIRFDGQKTGGHGGAIGFGNADDDSYKPSSQPHDIIFEKNTVENMAYACIKFNGLGARNVIIRDNSINGCGYQDFWGEGIYIGKHTGSLYGDSNYPIQDNIEIYRNNMQGFTENAIDAKPNTANISIHDNVIHHQVLIDDINSSKSNSNDGTITLSGHSGRVYNNVFYSNKGGMSAITVLPKADHKIYNNVFYNYISPLSSSVTMNNWGSQWADGKYADSLLYNNTFYNMPTDKVDKMDSAIFVVKNNIGLNYSGNITKANTSSSFFMNPSAGDFRLQPNASAVIDKASASPYSSIDINSYGINGSYRDMGAYEYGSVAQPVAPSGGSVTVYTGSNLSFSDTGLSAGSNYSYTLTASNSAGTSGASTASAMAPLACSAGAAFLSFLPAGAYNSFAVALLVFLVLLIVVFIILVKKK